jgi:hypothetical protein
MSEIKTSNASKSGLVFGKKNYLLFIASIVVVAIGFFLMAGNEDIYSFTKIRVAPFVVVVGFALGIASILIKPTKTD